MMRRSKTVRCDKCGYRGDINLGRRYVNTLVFVIGVECKKCRDFIPSYYMTPTLERFQDKLGRYRDLAQKSEAHMRRFLRVDREYLLMYQALQCAIKNPRLYARGWQRYSRRERKYT